MMKKMFVVFVTALYVSSISFAHAAEKSKEVDSNVRGISLKSYGQLSVSSQNIHFQTANEWVAIPFSSTGPKHRMGVSVDSPAKIKIKHAGVYQLNVNVYFSVENSHEGTFDEATYTLGFRVNGGDITPVASAFASGPGSLSCSYNAIIDFADEDKIKFYMKSSVAGFGTEFNNIVTLENGSAHLIKI